MSNYCNAIGVDVSKKSLDVVDFVNNLKLKVDNNAAGFKKIVKWVKLNNCQGLSSILWCMEHTGLYSLPLAVFLTERKISFAMIAGLEMKRSMGIQRGKSDLVDARRIAEYAYLRREHISLFKLPSIHILELKTLLTLRERMVAQRAGYLTSKKEMKEFLKEVSSKAIFESQNKIIREFSIQIARVEEQIKLVIEKDEVLNKTYGLATSVKGIGFVVGATLVVYSNCFTSFSSWRKFACFSGIAPFEYSSGTSIKAKTRIHRFGNKRLKSLLSNAAAVSIQHNAELKTYYQRRLREGKDKMSTLNIIRNKLLARAFAAVQRGTNYVNTAKFAS